MGCAAAPKPIYVRHGSGTLYKDLFLSSTSRAASSRCTAGHGTVNIDTYKRENRKPAHLHHGRDEGKCHKAHAAHVLDDVTLPQRLQQGGVAARQQERQGTGRIENIVENLVAAADIGVLRRIRRVRACGGGPFMGFW